MFSILFSLFVFCLSLQGGNCISPLFHFCFDREVYTDSSPYGTNLNQLVHTLQTKVPHAGFRFGSVGQGIDQVNGLALCRGDVNPTNCMSCVDEASKVLQQGCPNEKGAIVWYDYCLLKYSHEYFYGKIDDSNKFYLINGYKVDGDHTTFNGKVNELLSSLSDKASGTNKLYATGELKLEESKTMYGLAQCTRDLSAPRCKKCLDDAISELPNCCDGQQGGRVVGGSCYVRYELYPIVQA